MVATASRKSVTKHRSSGHLRSTQAVRWDKKMSNNCAASLLAYTLMQMFLFLSFIDTKGMSIAPYFGLVLLVAVIIPFCRKFEKRWEHVADSGLTEQSLAARFRRDQVVLWFLTFSLPFILIGLVKMVGSLF